MNKAPLEEPPRKTSLCTASQDSSQMLHEAPFRGAFLGGAPRSVLQSSCKVIHESPGNIMKLHLGILCWEPPQQVLFEASLGYFMKNWGALLSSI